MLASLVSGKADLADWLYLIAAIIFAVVAILAIARKTYEAALMPAGLCLVAVAFLVL